MSPYIQETIAKNLDDIIDALFAKYGEHPLHAESAVLEALLMLKRERSPEPLRKDAEKELERFRIKNKIFVGSII